MFIFLIISILLCILFLALMFLTGKIVFGFLAIIMAGLIYGIWNYMNNKWLKGGK